MSPIEPPEGATDRLSTPSKKGAKARPDVKHIVPLPDDAPRIPAHPKLGLPHQTWCYKTAGGKIVGFICRWNTSNGERDKTYSPLIWGVSGDEDARWHYRGFATPRPLYNLDKLAQSDGPVLVVEGEKAADAAARYLPDGWTVTTSPGGGQAVKHCDWPPLRSRAVVIWPDNDDPGRDYAGAVVATLSNIASTIRVASVPIEMPEKWDLADDLPDTLSESAIIGIIESALTYEEQPIGDPNIDQEIDPNIDVDRSIVPLGYDNGIFYLMSAHSKQIQEMPANRICDEAHLRALCPIDEYWANRAESGGKIDWKRQGMNLMAACYSKGVYRSENARGRGAWMDEGRVVIHLGDELLLDGRLISPTAIKSQYFYPAAQRFSAKSGIERGEWLSDDASSRLVRLIKMLRWANPLSGDLFAGWIATSLVCGALKWRPHAWITSQRGSGKTYIVNEIVHPILGDIALYPLGRSSEAGVRQSILRDARPIVFDEAETEGRNAEEKRQEIMSLMRMSSSESPGHLMKGTVGHNPVEFKIRSMFLLASIGVSLKKSADESRCVVLTLEPSYAHTMAARQAKENHFSQLRQEVSSLLECDPNFGAKLFARMVRLIPILRRNVETFSSIIAQTIGDRRVGDQMGTLAAGLYSLMTQKEVTQKEVEAYIEARDWSEFVHGQEIQEDEEILRYLVSSTARVELTNGTKSDRPIGELCAIACRLAIEDKITVEEARRSIRYIGIRWDGNNGDEAGFYISNDHKALNDLMMGSEYGSGWQRILKQMPVSKPSRSTIQFHYGAKTRARWLPVQALLGLDGNEGEDSFLPDDNVDLPF